MAGLCADGICPPWIQILLEQPDNFDISGKAIKDIVLVPITQIYKNQSSSQHELSRFGGESNMDGTNRHDLSSYAWDTSMCHSALNRTQNGEISLGQEIYLLKLEKKLKRAQDQVAFDSQVDT